MPFADPAMTETPLFTTDDLTLASTPERVSPGKYTLRVPDGWQQGRGAFGGLVLSALARAIEMAEPEPDRKHRSFNGEIAGPVLPGEALIEVTELRRGTGLSVWNATLTQQGQPLVRASSILARARSVGTASPSGGRSVGTASPSGDRSVGTASPSGDRSVGTASPSGGLASSPATLHMPAPSIPPASGVPIIPIENAPFVPVFSRHLEFRVVGPLPFSGAKEPVAEGWVRTKRSPPTLGAPELVALADAWWPAALATAPTPRPVGTVMFGLQLFLPEAPLDPTQPLFHRGRVLVEHEGYMAEMRELWTEDGRLLALNQQTIAWIR